MLPATRLVFSEDQSEYLCNFDSTRTDTRRRVCVAMVTYHWGMLDIKYTPLVITVLCRRVSAIIHYGKVKGR